MKKIIAILAMIVCNHSSFSQNSLSFCATVEKNGFCVFNNTRFIASPDSTSQKIVMEIHGTDKPIGTTKAVFKIYSVAKDGVEKLADSLVQKIDSDWMYAWIPYAFKAPGKYDVKIFNDSATIMCSKSFELMDLTAAVPKTPAVPNRKSK